ncbi:MAG: helix-turn-helix domain-containing protein [Lachnospiraceae bacterium]|nr:helix-turn-helix domain-containing protein [Lachnospiraceae bacterium]
MADERYEVIQFSPKIPVKVFVHKVGVVASHWHKSLELLLVLDGQITITVDGQTYDLKSEDLILINSNSIHEIHSQSAVMIAVQLKLEMFTLFHDNPESLFFDCNSVKSKNPEAFSGLRFGIAQMVHENSHRDEGTDYKNMSLSYYLIGELMDHFKVQETEEIRIQKKYMARLTQIVEYINTHYQENFSLRDLAESQQLSVPYLSSFFNKYMGINFSQYYTNVKLEHALQELMETDHPLEIIAQNNGFAEVHTFVRCFKKKYNQTPGAYRREMIRDASEQKAGSNLNYYLLEPGNYLHLLTKYLPSDGGHHQAPATEKTEAVNIGTISITRPTRKLRHTFKTFITVGKAKDLLNHEIQEMLRDIQSVVGYQYIKFHGIFSDDMLVCTRSGGELHFRFTLVDSALDFLLSIGLKPMIQLSFMPLALASDPDKNVYQSPFNTSPPADINEWNFLVESFIRHLFFRYGEEEVLSWLFCVWNEPVTPAKMFGFDNDRLFFDFYRDTFRTVKSVHKKLVFGSPSLLFLVESNLTWIKDFLAYADRENCRPEFLNIHYYSDIIPESSDDFVAAKTRASRFPTRTDDFSLFIGSIRKVFRSCGYGDVPVYMTEWNFTMSHRNLINDTCFKSCYIMKNLLKNYDRLDSFGYWSLTDLMEEHELPETLFHGGLGIYTMNGIRKNVFYTFAFASRLGDDLLDSGDGYFITKKSGSIQIITYNYIHYGDLFASGELFDINETSRYSAFNMSRRLSLSLRLSDSPNGRYEVKEYFVNQKYGSAFDLWVSFGGAEPGAADTRLLKSRAVPEMRCEYKIVENHTLHYQVTLEPLEIRFTEIRLLGM